MLAHLLPATKPETIILANRYNLGMIIHNQISVYSQQAADRPLHPICKRRIVV